MPTVKQIRTLPIRSRTLKIALETEAVVQYEKKNFKGAHDNFIKILDLNKLPQMKNVVDTIYYYYGGRAALEDSNYTEANRMFEEAVANKYEDPFLYVFRKQSYFGSGDTAKGVAVIKEGFEKYPENQSILIEMINYYLTSNQTDEALRLLSCCQRQAIRRMFPIHLLKPHCMTKWANLKMLNVPIRLVLK